MTKFDLKQYLELVEFSLTTVEQVADRLCKDDSQRNKLITTAVFQGAETLPHCYILLKKEDVKPVYEVMALITAIAAYRYTLGIAEYSELIGDEAELVFLNAVDSTMILLSNAVDHFDEYGQQYPVDLSLNVQELRTVMHQTIEALEASNA